MTPRLVVHPKPVCERCGKGGPLLVRSYFEFCAECAELFNEWKRSRRSEEAIPFSECLNWVRRERKP